MNASGANAELLALLGAFPQLRGTPSLAPCTGGFSGAGIWKVTSDSGDFCLRRWTPDVAEDRLAALHRLLAHVAARGVSETPVPLCTRQQTTFLRSHGHLWQLEPWVPGRADFHERPSEAKLRDAMRCLAAWHRAARDFTPRTSETAWFSTSSQARPPAIISRLSYLDSWTAERLTHLERAVDQKPGSLQPTARSLLTAFHRRRSDLSAQLAWAKEVRVPVQPCLRDVWHDHVLFQDDRVTGLIDPSAARTDTVATDLARLLGSLLGSDHAAHDRALAEYAKHNPLTTEEMHLVPILDLSGVLLSGIRWLDRIYVRHEIGPSGQVFARVRQIAERLATL